MRMIKNFYCDSRGSISIMWAILLPMIAGTIGLGVDTGMWYRNTRSTQMAVDAAALSAAHSVSGGATQQSMQALVTAELARNGITSADGTGITVNYPPTSGSQSGSSNAVEIIVTRPQNRIFSVFALNSNPTIQLRTVAIKQSASNGSACILALSDSDSNAIDINGNVNLNMSTCAIASNSNRTNAIKMNGNITVNAYQLYSHGGISQNGNIHVTTTESNTTYGDALNDPYSAVDVPSYSGCDHNGKSYNGNFGTVTISEGVYCNGISANGNGTLNFNPGTYVIDRGSLNINGNINITGTDVTIILTSSTGSSHATVSINGNANVSISAPSSNDSSGSITGNYAGMLFYRDRNASGSTVSWNGNATMAMTGVMYFPNDEFRHNGNASNSTTCTQIVANTVKLNGNAKYSTSCAGTGVSPISLGDSTVRLAE